MTRPSRGGITQEERGVRRTNYRRGTEGTRHVARTGQASTNQLHNAVALSSPDSLAPTREQHRLILDNFGVNQWSLTRSHMEKLDGFIRQILSSSSYEILLIEGRASNTGPESESQIRRGGHGPGNIELSRLRAESVVQFLNERDLFSSHVPQVVSHGSLSPLAPAGGEVARNRSVVISYTLIRAIPPQPPAPIRTRRWALQIEQVASGGYIIGGLLANGKLKNLDTNQIYTIKMWALGLAGGIPFSVSGAPSDFQQFETFRSVDAFAFSNSATIYEALSFASIGGYSVAVVRFPHLSEGPIWLSGAIGGLDLSSFLGTGRMNYDNASRARARTERREYRRAVEAYNRELEEYERQE